LPLVPGSDVIYLPVTVTCFDLGAAVELFRAEKFGDIESNNDDSLRECRSCDNKLRLIRAVYYPETEETIRVFECDCGERTWDE
jgi:hypothetical protein